MELPALDNTFWIAVAVLMPLNILALVLYIRALALSPLSLTIPFLALTPVFLILVSFLILGELPTGWGVCGILIIVVGTYLLNMQEIRQGWWRPLTMAAHEPGSRLMIMVAFIYSFTSTLGKLAVLHSGPDFFSLFLFAAMAIGIWVIMWAKLGRRSLGVFSRPGRFSLIGLASALMIFTHFRAIELIEVAYMISVKRSSLVLSVLYGALWFGEEHISWRLIGSGLMVLGIIVISLLG